MREINIWPIRPMPEGYLVMVPTGSVLLTVTKSISQVNLHVLQTDAETFEEHRIHAYIDRAPHNSGLFQPRSTPVPDGDIGHYIGTLAESGSNRFWHFFDKPA